MLSAEVRAEVRAGARSVAPLLVGIIPFGLVAGATPVADGLGGGVAVGFSVFVFAGASQLAAIDVLGTGGSALVAAVAAWTINLRLLLYSASLAPHLARERLRTRLAVAYLLTDQAYGACVGRWGNGDDPERRVPFYFGGALFLWVSWQLSTIAGVLVGATVSDEVPLEFAVPLAFLTLLVPVIIGRPAAVCASTARAPREHRASTARAAITMASCLARTVAAPTLPRRRRARCRPWGSGATTGEASYTSFVG